MALLNVETAEEQTFISSGGGTSWWDSFVQSYLNPEPTPTPTPTTLVNVQTVEPTQPKCLTCTVPTGTTTTTPTGPTLPPPNIVLNSPLSAVSQTGGKPTYSALAGTDETDKETGPGMQSDWWKYLVGAAIGYALARMK
jgi:hypothetical protein